MGLQEYLKYNGISAKNMGEASAEQIMVSRNFGPDYFDGYFQTGLDEFLDCVDYDLNRVLFDILLGEAKHYDDIFEPCCQSGILGCYLASQTKGHYKGIDINKYAIDKAHKRAELNGLGRDIFEIGDMFLYDKTHEAIAGRCILNNAYFSLNPDALGPLSKIAKNIFLIEGAQPNAIKDTIKNYERALNSRGYSFALMSDPMESPATGAFMFIVKAEK